MNIPFFTKKEVVPVWVYKSHDYVGVVDGNHGYVVVFERGAETRSVNYHFHCKSVNIVKDTAKLVRYFKAMSDTLT